MSISDAKALHVWQGKAQESTLLVNSGQLRTELWQAAQVRPSFLHQDLPSSR